MLAKWYNAPDSSYGVVNLVSHPGHGTCVLDQETCTIFKLAAAAMIVLSVLLRMYSTLTHEDTEI